LLPMAMGQYENSTSLDAGCSNRSWHCPLPSCTSRGWVT
jgi:hypothetical protein